MAVDMDDEILQDFLVEAGEILEQLNEQLLDLEQHPDDFDLLNAVFRGFHTIKGGAGFLSIEPLVEVCHRAEDVFNILRQGERQADAHLMDTMLQVLDVVNDMFTLIHSGEEPEPADPALLTALDGFAEEEATESAAEPVAEIAVEIPEKAEIAESILPVSAETPAPAADDEITEEEFETLLDQLHGAGKHGGLPAAGDAVKKSADQQAKAASDGITEAEFEALLDELHGKGKHGGRPGVTEAGEKEEPNTQRTGTAGTDEISEHEFESLLDELHGKGKHGGRPATKKTVVKEQPAAQKTGTADSDEITEAEFDALLDDLHGKGKFGDLPGAGNDKNVAAKEAVVEQAKVKLKEKPKEKPETKAPSEPETAKKNAATATKEKAKKVAPAEKPAKAKSKAAQATKPTAEPTVRVDTARLDEIMNMVGELVLVRNRLATLRSKLGDEEVANAVANLDLVTADLQNSVMKTRMQPVKKVFGRFPRVVRDLARSLKKEIDLEMQGEETDLDKNLIEALADPMVHLVRNAVDHGIETPQEREKAGKPRRGKVILSAAQEGDHILLSIEDDGKGMDADVLRRKAVEKGMMDQEAADRLDDKECYNLIFQPGFSTKTEISDVSGRGVGMDVVKTGIVRMNGSVEIDSELGKGSTIIIKLPLTLAILPTLMVVLGTQPFALPLTSVVEIFNLDLSRTNVVDGQLTIMVRERALPLFYLRNWLISGSGESSQGHVVVANVGGRSVGLVVDYLIGQEEVVIKPLGKTLQGLEGMAGATITGNGKIALILDVPGLIRKYARKY